MFCHLRGDDGRLYWQLNFGSKMIIVFLLRLPMALCTRMHYVIFKKIYQRCNQNNKSKEEGRYNDQKKKDKQWSTKYYTVNKRSSNTNPTKTGVNSPYSTCGTRRVTLFLLHVAHVVLTFRMILRPVKNDVNVLIKKSRISVL